MSNKGYNTKYKKRKQREHINSLARRKRVEIERRESYARASAARTEKTRIEREKRPLYKGIADILTKRICELEPRYESLLRLRALFQITNLFGVNPRPEFPVILNTVYEDYMNKEIK